MNYDYLIVGCGMFGSVFARQATDAGKKVLVIDKRPHIAGNCYTEKVKGIEVHKYGPHVFHTNNEQIWKYINRFADFNHFTYRAKVNYKDKMYSFPINMMTLHQLWGVKTPDEARKKLEEVRIKIENPANLEEWILSQVGQEVYETFIKGYTIKQWQQDPKDLPTFIIKRLPIRLTYNDNYFNDRFQGIPIGGYTKMFENILDGIEVKLNTDFFQDKIFNQRIAKKIIFTGKIDEYFDFKEGVLDYRTIKFDHRIMKGDYQGNAAINHTDINVDYTRTIEHKHFEFKESDDTVVTFEYPEKWGKDKIPLYPMNNKKNNDLYKRYKDIAKAECKNILFGGRLAEYKYYDMHQVIGSALSKSKKVL